MRFVCLLACCLGVALAQWAPPHENDCGPLCDYVRRDDGHYKLENKQVVPGENCTSYYFNMTSQRWRADESWMDRPVWWHWIVIHIPNNGQLVYTDRSVVYIGTGNNEDMDGPSITSRHVNQTRIWCQRTGMVTSVIRQIPNQPIRFNGTLRNRSEDSIIAYTWKEYMLQPPEEKDPELVLRMPMCKAISKIMDAVQEVMLTDPTSIGHSHVGTEIKHFMVAGESKRGWTTWMMPAVDSRVEVISPIVLSCLNIKEMFMKYYMSLDGWPVATGDYWLANIMGYVGTQEFDDLMDLVDPYSYRYRQFLENIPKLVISAAADEFFMMDDYDYFYDGLPGVKRMWIQENTTHSLNKGPLHDDFWRMLETFYIAHIKGKAYPEFEYHRQLTSKGGSILLHTNEPVTRVAGWMSTTLDVMGKRRDFRSLVLDPVLPVEPDVVFKEKEANNLGNGWYEVYYDNPPEGKYRAFFVKIEFPWAEEGRTFILSTKAMYLPDGFPFGPCEGDSIRHRGCRGLLR